MTGGTVLRVGYKNNWFLLKSEDELAPLIKRADNGEGIESISRTIEEMTGISAEDIERALREENAELHKIECKEYKVDKMYRVVDNNAVLVTNINRNVTTDWKVNEHYDGFRRISGMVTCIINGEEQTANIEQVSLNKESAKKYNEKMEYEYFVVHICEDPNAKMKMHYHITVK